MARKDVNIGLTGNDGKGDSIRDAFAKVNANFQELYASQGLEAGLTFDNLVDVIKPLRPNTVLGLDNLGKTVISRDLVANNGISIDTSSNSNQIVFSIAGITIRQDPTPTLSNNLDAGGFRLSRISDPADDNDAVSRQWVYQNFLNRDNIDLLGSVQNIAGSTMRKNFKIAPLPNNGSPNAGERFITVKSSDGVTDRFDVLLKYQAIDPAHATRKDYVDTKLSLQGTETLDPATGLVNRGFGVMTGPLILNDHPGEYAEILRKPDGTLFVQDDYRAVTKGYVDSKSYSSPSNLYVSTVGNDDMWDFVNDRPNPVYGYPEHEIGRSFSKAFKSLNIAAKFAKKYIDRATLQNIPYQVSPAQINRWVPDVNPLQSPRTRVRVSIQSHGFVDGDYVKVSGAILGTIDTRQLNGTFRVNKVDDNNFELNLKAIINWSNPQVAPNTTISIALANKKDGPYSLSSKVDYGYRGFFVPKPEITIFVESGVYYEEFPILVPPNVAIKGDEFRRTIIRPKEGPPTQALNQTLKFVRGDRSQSADFWYSNHYYHMLARSVGTTNVVGSTKLEIRNAAYRPKSGMRFIVGTVGGQPNVYRVGSEKTIVYRAPSIDDNIATGTYIVDIVDEVGDPKRLANGIGDGTTVEFFLDNEHCDALLVSDAFQLRNTTFMGCKGFNMAFDPNGQILTRSPYAQVCATFAGEGGGGQLIDGMSGNQVCYVLDNSFTDPFTGTQGAQGTKITVTGLVRRPEIPNTFYLSKKKYVIIDSTTPDSNGTATLTLSSTTPIEEDDRFLPAGFIPNNSQILIETAGNRSMLSNDFTQVNDLGYGIVAENNGVAESVSQFTYYCRVSYLAKSGGQLRTVTGSSCYGLIGLQSEGSDPNEDIQIGRIKTNIGNIMTPYIDDPKTQGIKGSIALIIGNLDSKPVRNATFKLTKHEVVIKNIARARLSGGSLTNGPLTVTTQYKHPFVTGDSVQLTSVRGLQLPPVTLGGPNRTTDLDGSVHTITVLSSTTFRLEDTESTDYVSDLGSYLFADTPCKAVSVLLAEAQDVTFTVKGDPGAANITGKFRVAGAIGDSFISVDSLQRPAVLGMKFTLSAGAEATIFKVTEINQPLVTFKASPRPSPTGDDDNKIGAQDFYISNVSNGWTPKAGWSFQLLDTNLEEVKYTRYTVTGTPTYDAVAERWLLTIDKPLDVVMVNQIATAQVTRVDGIWDLTLDRELDEVVALGTTVTFTDSYWTIGLDPALTNDFPKVVDEYNKPHAKAVNLWQQKSISVSQIKNEPPIINSSAMRFASTNFDPSIYRILGKTVDGTITKDTYEITATASPLSGFNVSAVEKLVASKTWIQEEVVKYLATIYPNFQYNIDICYRDVGYIIDAVAFDLTYGGNVRSRAAGVSYYQQGNPSAALVLSQQKPETIDAINFATSAALTALNDYSGATDPQFALPYRGSNLNGVAQLIANKEFIQEEVIAYLRVAYPGFNYDEDKCARDVGLIVNAVLGDLVLGTNYLSRHAGLAYLRSYSNVVTSQQKVQTIAGINKARDLALDLITDQDSQAVIVANMAIVTNIINAVSESVAPALTFTNPLNTDAGIINGVELLRANRTFIQAEIIAYINENFVGYTYTTPIQTKCERDVGIIIDSALYDMVLGTNYNAVTTGLAYQRANSLYLQGNQKEQTVAGIEYAKDLVETSVGTDATPLSRVAASFVEVVDILRNNTPDVLNFPNPGNVTQDLVDAKTQLQQNRTFIQAEIIAYVNNNTPPVGYDQAKCLRDVGYIVDALSYDILYGGNSATRRAAEAYFVGTSSQLGAGQATATINAYTHLQAILTDIVQGVGITRTSGNTSQQQLTGGSATSAEASTISGLVEIIKDVITAGTLNVLPAVVNPDYSWADVSLRDAALSITNDKSTIIADTSAFIETAFSGFTVNESACSRDTGYIVDSLTFDLLYGGNSQSNDVGNAYYNVLGSTVIPGQVEVTVLVYTHLKNIVENVIQAVAVTPTTGNSETQNTVLTSGSTEARTTVSGLTLNIIDIIKGNSGASAIPPTYTNGANYADKNDDRLTILAQLETIKNGVISFLNASYNSGFQFNQTTCRRDVGLIIDAIAYDLEYDSNVQSLTAAFAYFDAANASAAYVLSSQKTQTIAALNRARDVAMQVVLETPVTRTSGNIATQDTSGTPGVSGVDNARVQTLMNYITGILANGKTWSGIPARNLGIRRSYQNPNAAGYVPQPINNSLTAEPGVGTSLTALMNQINAIIQYGPVNPTGPGAVPHIFVQTQILDTLQTLDFPASATSLQYGGVLTGTGLATGTSIRTVTQLFDANQETIGYRVRISNPVTQSIPAGSEITITGPGTDYIFDLNTALDLRHIAGDVIGITTTFSTVRATGHDFLEVGAGGFDDSNYPHNVYGQAVNTPSDGAIVSEVGTGRVFHVSTDQNGNFRVGSYFNVNQGDGSVSIKATIGLSAVSSLSFLTGATVNQFSYNQKLEEDSDNIVPTQKAIKAYIADTIDGIYFDGTETPDKGLLTLNGNSVMVGNLNVGYNPIINVVNSGDDSGMVNKKYVDNVFAGGTINYTGAFEIETTGKRNEVLAFEMISDVTTAGGVLTNRGAIDLNSNRILRLRAPIDPTDATNKLYVDQAIATGGVRTGWSGFTLANTTVRNSVTAINITNNGSGYVSPPAVVFYSTSGTGATARAILAGGTGPRVVASIVVDNAGYGYTEAPDVIIGGSIAIINVNSAGVGYSSTPTITISAPNTTGGVRAQAYAVMGGQGTSQFVDYVVITNAGVGYTVQPTIQLTGGGNPATHANLVASLQAGSGARGSASIAETQRNINLNGNRVTGSADPVNATDLVTWKYFDEQNFIGKIKDVTITGTPTSGDFLVFTGVNITGSQGNMVNAGISSESVVQVSRANNEITFSIKDGSITNADVATSAGILQTKLSLNKAATVASSVTPAPGDFGVVAFLDNQFVSNSGFVELRQASNKTTGVTFDRMQQVTNFTVLGRYNTGEAVDSIGSLTELTRDNMKSMLGLSAATVGALINDDILGGIKASDGLASGLTTRDNGTTSYGAILKTGGTMRGPLTMTDGAGLPAGDAAITPIIRASVTDKLDIGSSTYRFRNVYSKQHYGDTFEGSTFGSATAPTTQGSGAAFKGTATYAGQAAQTQYSLSGTILGSGDILIKAGTTSATFNGSADCTISIISDVEATDNTIVRRTSAGYIKAKTFVGPLDGNASTATGILSGTTTYTVTSTATDTNIPLRNNGVITATTFSGRASTANFADLAERYQADAQYEPGTVLEFGGEFEVTIAEDETRRVAGVVSTDPAYLMNTELEGDNVVAIALQGRVPCKVRGKIRKGDMLVSAGNGYARPTTDPKIGTIIGKALENFDGIEGVIEVVVGRL